MRFQQTSRRFEMDGELHPPTILSVFAKYFVSVGAFRGLLRQRAEENLMQIFPHQLSFRMRFVARRDVDNC